MNVHGDTGNIDSAKFLEYIVNQFPGDLKSMVEARDELAKRQGAMSAVEAAVADRAAASVALEAAKAEAKDLLADAKEKNAAATAKGKELDAQEKAFAARCADMEVTLQAKADAVAERERRVSSNEVSQATLKNKLEERSAQLDSDRAVLDSRVKVFQDKVAALSV
jgi:chromosome segregation ATPase